MHEQMYILSVAPQLHGCWYQHTIYRMGSPCVLPASRGIHHPRILNNASRFYPYACIVLTPVLLHIVSPLDAAIPPPRFPVLGPIYRRLVYGWLE